jgi:hypothetical protein
MPSNVNFASIILDMSTSGYVAMWVFPMIVYPEVRVRRTSNWLEESHPHNITVVP